MNFKFNILNLLVVIVILFSITSIFVEGSDFVTEKEKTDFYNLIDSYYFSFLNKEMDSYLNTQFLNHLSDKELDAKKSLINQMWDKYNSGYSLSDLEDWKFTLNDGLAIVNYKLNGNLFDINGNELDSYNGLEMTALLFQTKDKWKIFNIVPTSVFDFNTVIDLLNNETINNESENTTFNETEKINSTKNETSKDKFKRAIGFVKTKVNDKKIPICKIDFDEFKKTKSYSLKDISGIDKLIGNDKIIHVKIGEVYELYYNFLDGNLNSISATSDVDFTVTTDTCTLQRINEGSDPMVEYENGKIKLKGEKFTSKFKTVITKIIFEVYSWFVPKSSFEKWIEAETAVLKNKGKYTFEGPTSRGPGELYLGDKGAVAEYEFESNFEGKAYLYISVNDDKKHRNGARSVIFTVNGEKINYDHISENTITGTNYWKWKYLGVVNLVEGKNEIEILKPQQTSAAFIMDKFLISEKEKTFN